VPYWAWLEEGSFRWSAPPLIQDGGFDLVSVNFLTNSWVNWSDFWLFNVGDWRKVPFEDHLRHSSKLATILWTSGRFLSMISSAAHPTPPLQQPSWIWFPSIIWWTPVDWSDFLVPHWGVINLHHVPLLPKPYLLYTHRQCPTRGAYAMPCVALVQKYYEIRLEKVKIIESVCRMTLVTNETCLTSGNAGMALYGVWQSVQCRIATKIHDIISVFSFSTFQIHWGQSR
jgi:hypothetical protein